MYSFCANIYSGVAKELELCKNSYKVRP